MFRKMSVSDTSGKAIAPPKGVFFFSIRDILTDIGDNESFVHRLLDVSISIFALVLFAPLMLIIALLIKLSDGGNIIFSHKRIGKDGTLFPIFKFRTMRMDSKERLEALLATDPSALTEWKKDHKLKNDPRITRLGKILRKSSLDELPQFFNVLRGEMSLVGPRPIVLDEIEHYGSHFKEYISVKPGITGIWQISGRNNIGYKKRVAMDILYARKKSPALDLKVMLLTIPAVLFQSGSY